MFLTEAIKEIFWAIAWKEQMFGGHIYNLAFTSLAIVFDSTSRMVIMLSESDYSLMCSVVAVMLWMKREQSWSFSCNSVLKKQKKLLINGSYIFDL